MSAELAIDKLAIVYAMEHDLPAKLIRDFMLLVTTSDRRTLEGLVMFRNGGARKALMDAMPGEWPHRDWPRRESLFVGHQDRLISLLRKNALLR